MTLQLGDNIRALRRQHNRTQDALAQALDVTPQAVSRWEMNQSYPDMELIPAIANFFGVTIDALFGCERDREQKIDSILARVTAMENDNMRDDVNLTDCIAILREGLAEFPGNERLTRKLADILTVTGWRRHGEWLHYNDEGYLRADFDRHQKNEYWNEAMELYKRLIRQTEDPAIRSDAVCQLMMLYRNTGYLDGILELSRELSPLSQSREIMLALATDGKTQARYLGNAILALTHQLTEQMMYALVNNIRHFDGGDAMNESIATVRGLIELYRLLCPDGNLGLYHRSTAHLGLYLSRLMWENGNHDEAFEALEQALRDAKAYDALSLSHHPMYTSPLLREADLSPEQFVEKGTMASNLPTDWPLWCNPDYSRVKEEITADPRWADWVKRCTE